jgi:hypothetical protein
MSHQVKQSFEELEMGARILLLDSEHEWELVAKGWDKGEKWLTLVRRGTRRAEKYENYASTLLNSPGFQSKYDQNVETGAEDYWSECEQYYGINHLGDEDPCPLRQLAFRILKGDPMALDAARDILKC